VALLNYWASFQLLSTLVYTGVVAAVLGAANLAVESRTREEGSGMAKLVFGMNQSLDGYVDHMAFTPSPTLFHHFVEEAQEQAGSVYGRRMYEVMSYWDDDRPEWDAGE
jgi:hypothetical protein